MLHMQLLALNSAPHLLDLCLFNSRHNGSYKGLFEVNLSMALCFKPFCVKIMRELRGKEIWLVFLLKPTFIPFFCDFCHMRRKPGLGPCSFVLVLCVTFPNRRLLLISLDLPLASQLESSTLCRARLMITVANFPDDFYLPGLLLLPAFST